MSGTLRSGSIALVVGDSIIGPVLSFDNRPINSPLSFVLLTIAEVAKLLKISVSGTRRLQQERHIPFVKVGGSVRFVVSDVLSYLEKQRVESIG